jgi:hypothetical protein
VTATVRTWDHSFACGIHDDQTCTCKETQPVSGATYRIDVEHRPDPSSTVQWIARVTRLSDDYQVTALWGKSADDAITNARAVRAKRQAVGTLSVRERRRRGSDLVTYLAALSIFVLTVIVARLILGWAMA